MQKPSLLNRLWQSAAHWAEPSSGGAPPDREDAFAEARARMVAEQLAGGGSRVVDPSVLTAMGRVPRHEFVPEHLKEDAYRDRALPIGYRQTISQPYVVALMTQELEIMPGSKVLEIGTGSGYQAAVLAEMGARVYTIEIVEALAKRAVADLERLGYGEVLTRVGDGYFGWPEAAPFDAVIVACAPERVPQPLVEQLADDGRLMIPVGARLDQSLVLLRKHAGQLETAAVLPVRFVPMTGHAQATTES